MLLFAVLLSGCQLTFATEDYGKCSLHSNDYDIKPSKGEGKFCIQQTISTYCIEWNCPLPECDEPITPDSGCPFCNGTCSYGGMIYKVREHFKCVDGVNSCFCLYDGSVGSTRIGVNIEFMCKDKPDPK